MPPFADFKKRAGNGYAATRDKYSSTPSSNLGYNPPRPSYRPPSQPHRLDESESSTALEDHVNEENEDDHIDWANLTYEDKQVFFSWLDEFFSRFTGRPISSFAPCAQADTPIPPQPVEAAPLTPALPRRPTSLSVAAPVTAPPPVPPPMPPRRTSSQTLPAPPMPPRRNESLPPAPPMPVRRNGALPSAPPMPPRRNGSLPPSAMNDPPAPRRTMPPPPPTGPPKLNYNTRPSAPQRTPSAQKPAIPDGDPLIELQMSFPDTPVHRSTAEDLAHYFSADTTWGPGDDWYTSDSRPPMHSGPMAQIRGFGGYRTHPDMQTTILKSGLIFADMSVCYFHVTYPSSPHSPDDRRVQRKAWYTLRPPSLPGDVLIAASNTYGEIVASFAERHVESGEKVWRGECWDIAYKGLELARELCPDQPPVPSIHCTHGHLIYCGKPGEGRWRGGDDRVRRGDIVQWRSAKVTVGLSYMTLGLPDHTAVIVRDCIPSISVSDGSFLPPAGLGELTFVGQNPNPPRMDTLQHAGMTEGEIWIYRPVCMREYVGFELDSWEPPAGLTLLVI